MLPPDRLPVPGPFPIPETTSRPYPRPHASRGAQPAPEPGPPAFRVPDLEHAIELLVEAGGRLRGPSVTLDLEEGRVCVQHLDDPDGSLIELQFWG